jgi:hypothetical protein
MTVSRSPPSREEILRLLETARTKRVFDEAVVALRKPGAFAPEVREELDAVAEREAARFATPEQKAQGGSMLRGRNYRFSFRSARGER